MARVADNQITGWLNTLGADDLVALFEVFGTNVGTEDRRQITGDGDPVGLAALHANGGRCGQWYMEWVKCEIANLSVTGGHPRWQPRIRSSSTGLTPSSLLTVGRQMKASLSANAWATLKVMVPGDQIKMQIHHLSFRRQHPHLQLPGNLGHGSSISHLCDQAGCVRGTHLELAAQHATNLVRQRCIGVTLIAGLDLIILELPCAHSVGNSALERINTSCRKIHMIRLPDDSIEALVLSYQELAEALASRQSSQTV